MSCSFRSCLSTGCCCCHANGGEGAIDAGGAAAAPAYTFGLVKGAAASYPAPGCPGTDVAHIGMFLTGTGEDGSEDAMLAQEPATYHTSEKLDVWLQILHYLTILLLLKP